MPPFCLCDTLNDTDNSGEVHVIKKVSEKKIQKYHELGYMRFFLVMEGHFLRQLQVPVSN